MVNMGIHFKNHFFECDGGRNILCLLTVCGVAGRVAKSAGGPSWKIAIPSTPPPHHGGEGVRSGAAELALRGEAHSAPVDERCYLPY
jgi:hypothetical protein